MTAHIDQRLAHRIRPYHADMARKLMSRIHGQMSIALAAHVDMVHCGKSSGDYLVIIVRNGEPVTAMYAYRNQMNVNHLRVNSIEVIA